MFVVPMTRGSLLSRGFDQWFAAADADAPRRPALDVAESDQAYTVTLDMPGVNKDEVKVSVEGRRVTVEAQARKEDEKKVGDQIVYRERSVSSFSRSFKLAAEIDQTTTQARLENGVLTLSLPKRNGSNTARITVN